MDDTVAPGTLEWAAAAKEDFARAFQRFQTAHAGGADLVTVLFSVAYENREGLCFGANGEPNDLINLMAVTLIDLADRAYEKVVASEKFLPDGNKTPYGNVVAAVSRDLLSSVHRIQRDNVVPDSGIILPNS